jgi:hypothetical protein
MNNTTEYKFRGAVLTKYVGRGGDVVIPEGVKEIAVGAFRGTAVTSVSIPDSVMSIGKDAFLGCQELARVRLPKGIRVIYEKTFYNCPRLTSISIPEGVMEIRYDAFLHCKGLSSVQIPYSVEELGRNVFTSTSVEAIAISKAAFDQIRKTELGEIATNASLGIAVKDEAQWSFFAYGAKLQKNNLYDILKDGNWNAYDQELINNGPGFKYKAAARLLGALGRILNPVDLTEEYRVQYMELLIKNAKKLIPLAEVLSCPYIVEAMVSKGIINDKNKKAIAKLLSASEVPEIATLTV